MQEYKSQLFSNNVSYYIYNLIQQKIGSEEVELATVCQLSRMPVKIPVRHSQISFVRCIFDLESWLEYYQSKGMNDSNGFQCPGCRKYANFRDYGIDFTLYHVLEMVNLWKKKNPLIKLDPDRIIHVPSTVSPQYYVQTKVPKQTQKGIRICPTKYLLPGTSAVLGIQKKQQEITKGQLQPQQKSISDEIAMTIVKLQQYLNSKIYKTVKSDKNKSFATLQNKILLKKAQLSATFRSSMKLVKLGVKSLKNDFVFALKKIQREKTTESILIVYFVHYDVWHEFPLKLNGRPYVQLEQALYIKCDGADKENHIYVIGGKTEERFKQSNQVLRIRFPKDPFQDGSQAVMEILPSLPQEGYNFMGSYYKGKLFIFYGQKQIRNQDQQIKDELLNSAYAFRYNRWEILNVNLVKRFDGSFFTINHPQFDKLIIFLGGVSHDPDGLIAFRCQQQHYGQIFICRDEQFFGSPKTEFVINFSQKQEDIYQKSVMCSPIFTAPHYGTNQLILSGEFLKYNNKEKREIYTFDWANGTLKLNEVFSLEPPEQILTPVRKLGNSIETFTPVQDTEGASAYGNFYVIHQYESQNQQTDKQNKVFTQLLRINLTNGLFFMYPYTDHATSLQRAKNQIQTLEQRESVYL